MTESFVRSHRSCEAFLFFQQTTNQPQIQTSEGVAARSESTAPAATGILVRYDGQKRLLVSVNATFCKSFQKLLDMFWLLCEKKCLV